jgi:hypothetical protein
MKDKIRSTMLEKTMNYLSILRIESDVTKSLFVVQAIEGIQSKSCREKSIKELCQSVN